LLVGALDIELDEGAGQFLLLPGRSRFARPQSDDDVFPANRLAGMKRNRLNDPVALVEDAEHRNPLRHRRDATQPRRSRRGPPGGRQRGILLLSAPPARGEGKRGQ
jgi:hypothetical protein